MDYWVFLNICLVMLKFTFKGVLLNSLVIIQLLLHYPLHFLISVLAIFALYRLFIRLGFNQKRSIKLSAPYLNGQFYLEQLKSGNPDPHQFYHLSDLGGLFTRPMYCFVCNRNVNNGCGAADGLCCDTCGCTVHTGCVSEVSNHCKAISTFDSLDDALHYIHNARTSNQFTLQDDNNDINNINTNTNDRKVYKSKRPTNNIINWHSSSSDDDDNDEQNNQDEIVLEDPPQLPTRRGNGTRANSRTRQHNLQQQDGELQTKKTKTTNNKKLTKKQQQQQQQQQQDGEEDNELKTPEQRITTRSTTDTQSTIVPHQCVQQQQQVRYFPSETPSDFALAHHFVYGNHSSISHFCYICNSSVGSLLYRHGMHCVWCGLHVHEDCLAKSQHTGHVLPPGLLPSAHPSQQPRIDFTSNNSNDTNNKNNNLNNNHNHNNLSRPIQYNQLYVCNLGALAKAIIPPHCIYPANGYTIASSRYEIATKYTHSALMAAAGPSAKPPGSFNTSPKLDYPQLFSFALPAWCYPLLVIINRKSGGNGGVEKMHDFLECLNPIQVWDLSTHPAELPLTIFKQSGRPFRVLVCGGDGTVSSVLHSIDHVFGTVPGVGGIQHSSMSNPSGVPPPPVATLPLGTGNDLAQVLGWGGKNPSRGPRQILSEVINGRLAVLDRWNVSVTPGIDGGKDTRYMQKLPPPPPSLRWQICDIICRIINPIVQLIQPYFPIFMPEPVLQNDDMVGIMNNYIGFGLDATIAHQFATLRRDYPHLFVSQTGNKLFYTRIGAGQYFYPHIRNGVTQPPFQTKIFVDDVEITGIEHLEGICCLGIKSFGGGVCFWGDRLGADENTIDTDPTSNGQFTPPALDDGKFELIGFENSLHMAMIQTGRALPHRLAQGRKLVVQILGKMPVQIDGEQWGVRENCEIVVQLRTQSLMIIPLHSGPTQSKPDDFSASTSLHQELNVTNMLHQVIQENVQQGVLSSAQSSKLMIDFTKQFTKANPSSHFYHASSIDF